MCFDVPTFSVCFLSIFPTKTVSCSPTEAASGFVVDLAHFRWDALGKVEDRSRSVGGPIDLIHSTIENNNYHIHIYIYTICSMIAIILWFFYTYHILKKESCLEASELFGSILYCLVFLSSLRWMPSEHQKTVLFNPNSSCCLDISYRKIKHGTTENKPNYY